MTLSRSPTNLPVYVVDSVNVAEDGSDKLLSLPTALQVGQQRVPVALEGEGKEERGRGRGGGGEGEEERGRRRGGGEEGEEERGRRRGGGEEGEEKMGRRRGRGGEEGWRGGKGRNTYAGQPSIVSYLEISL